MPESGRPGGGVWSEGWLRFARRLDSPNFGARPPQACIDLIVLHSISLPPGQYGGNGVADLFTNTLDWNAHPYYREIEGLKVSSHFYIQRGGEVWQFVSCNDRAWHAGASSYRGRDSCNDDSIGIELEGLEGGEFTDAQYESLLCVCQHIATRYPIAHVAGHEHIAPGRKGDPGAGLQWARLQHALAWGDQCFPQGTLSQRTP